ncbi:MAG: biotin--[acetyl-CoA-carboxylase] ligase [Waddliaceae bacterium]
MDYSHWHFSSINSTNTWPMLNAHLFDREKITLITAESQTEGKGRSNRSWISPPVDNLYASFCFFAPKKQQWLGNISQIMAITASKALESMGFHPKLKWPNDILLSGKKMGGILSEIQRQSTQVFVVVGIGMNINMSDVNLDGINRPATSLLLEGGKAVDVRKLIKQLQGEFALALPRFLKRGFSPFLSDYKKRLIHTPGQPLLFHDKEAMQKGIFHSINRDGSLKLELESGTIKHIVTGELC